MILRTWTLGLVSVGVAVGGCHHAGPSAQTAERKTVARVAMDSAQIERVCAHPDSVRAGLADCVLANQGRPSDTRPFEKPH
jgi:hypothetical protein